MKTIKYSDIKKQVKKILPVCTEIHLVYTSNNTYLISACETVKKENFIKKHCWQNEYKYIYYHGQYLPKEDKLIIDDEGNE